MDLEFLEKILNLFEKCQSLGKFLEINIDNDLVKILPLPRKLISDILSEESIPKFLQLSDDQTTLYFQNNLHLCPTDQNESGSCESFTCNDLHICKNYLLNNSCQEFKSYGKCSHSHSLSTYHNEHCLKKMNFSSKDENIYQIISRIIKLSSSSSSLLNSSELIVQSINGLNISDQLINDWLGQHKSLLIDSKILNSNTVQLSFDDDEVASMMENYLIQHHSKTALIKKDLHQNIDQQINHLDFNKTSIERPPLGRGRGRSQINNNTSQTTNQKGFSRRLPLNSSNNERKFKFSNRLNSLPIKTKSPEDLMNNDSFSSSSLSKFDDKQNDSQQDNDNIEAISSSNTNSRPRYILREHSTKFKEKTSHQTLINYIYTKPFIDEHLYYLFGPGKEEIIEKDQCEIFSCLSLGYCRVKNNEQGKNIEKQLYSILPEELNIQLIQIDQDLSLLICSSAAEFIFQQSQIDYAIISEPIKVQLNIEIIHAPVTERQPSITRNNSDHEDFQQSSSDGKFHIKTTDSTIDIISGDICQTSVDMMICISTSNNLCESVLRRAGPKIQSDYKERYHQGDALLLDGGSTSARKILFVPWQTEIEEAEAIETQKSLSDLVKWCIEQAHQRDMKSISFPPIGTGQLGLDPYFVCEAMIGAASERLHQYKLDVLFVIYSQNRKNDNQEEEQDECYQMFRMYLDSLCDQIKSVKVPTPTTNNERKVPKNQSIRREIQSKRLLALSDSTKTIKNYNLLIKSLEDIMCEKTYDLSLIESSIVDKIDLLIDICLESNVYPRIDYSREEIMFRGDHDSCFQCFFNICQEKKFYQYSYSSIDYDEKFLNPFISLKIDEAIINGESNICIKDNEQMIYNIDLKKFQIRFNKDKQSIIINKKQLNMDRKINIPSSWSSSLLKIRTIKLKDSFYKSLECFQVFQETMSLSDWQIERIESIENIPLYIHFMTNNKKEKSQLYYHACSYSSVQSIIHYGLHSTNSNNQSSICLTRDILNSHLHDGRPSTNGKYYIFAVQLAKNDNNNDLIFLSNEEIYLTLPTYLIVYQRQKNLH